MKGSVRPPVGILYGTMTLELGGKVTIECEKTKCFLELEFKLKVVVVFFLLVSRFCKCRVADVRCNRCPSLGLLQPFLGGACSVNQISGKIFMGEELLATVDGHWVRPLICSEASCFLL